MDSFRRLEGAKRLVAFTVYGSTYYAGVVARVVLRVSANRAAASNKWAEGVQAGERLLDLLYSTALLNPPLSPGPLCRGSQFGSNFCFSGQ